MMKAVSTTSERILDVAEALLQERGYNGFAYKDIAAQLGMRNASIHFHYPSKADLGVALARRYRERFLEEIDRVIAETSAAAERLDAVRGLFAATMERGSRFCLCGMLGAEMLTLPQAVAVEARRFFTEVRDRLEALFEEGRKRGQLVFVGSASTQAAAHLAVLEGAMIVARGLDSPRQFKSVVQAVTTPLLRVA